MSLNPDHPGLGMVDTGPCVRVVLMPNSASPETALLMVDTGAQKTVIENQVAERLGLKPIRFQNMVGVSQEVVPSPVYRMAIRLNMGADDGTMRQADFDADIIGMPTPPLPNQWAGLLGRDFLMNFRFVYEGTTGHFRIIHTVEGQAPVAPQTDEAKRRAKQKKQRDARRRSR